MTKVYPAQVLLGETLIGRLELTGDKSTFKFDDSYLELERRPVLGRWFEDHISPNLEVVGTHSRVPSFFQNYLPEPGSALRRIVAGEARVPEHREFAILTRLGDDLPGNIKVVGQIPVEETSEFASDPLAKKQTALRFSLAGVQLKFSVARSNDRFTLPVTGQGGRWILKFPDPISPHVPSNEGAMLTWASRAGIVVPDHSTIHADQLENFPRQFFGFEKLALAVKRFDRTEVAARIHQEDFAQVLGVPPEQKYEHANYATLARIILSIAGKDDYEQFVRRLVFMVVSGNADVHLKNWSLIYPDGIKPKLSPAYDLVCTVAYPQYDNTIALKLAGERDFSKVRLSHIARLAIKAGADADWSMTVARDAVERTAEAWNDGEVVRHLEDSLRQRVEVHVVAALAQLK